LTRFLGEVTASVEQGTPVAVADRALDPLGLPMTPFELLTLVRPPVAPPRAPAGPADAPVRAAHARRPAGGPARGRADARGIPRPVPRRRGTQKDGRAGG